MSRKIIDWIKNNPILASLIAFMTVQTIINAAFAMRIFQMQEMIRKLILKFSLQTWRV